MHHAIFTALHHGVRHFHFYLSYPDKPSMAGARSALTLRIMTLFRTLMFLRDSEHFSLSLRTKPENEDFFHEVYRTLRMYSFKIKYWLLDIRGLSDKEIIDGWTRMAQMKSFGQVENLGLFGGGQKEFELIQSLEYSSTGTAASSLGSAQISVHAMELYPMMEIYHEKAKYMLKLRKLKVAVCAYNVFGPAGKSLVDQPEVLTFARQYNVDPLLFFVKWAREMGFAILNTFVPEKWNRCSFAYGFGTAYGARDDLRTQCPPDFLERFTNCQVVISDLFDDKLSSLMRGSYKDDFKKSTSSVYSFRKSSIKDVAHLMNERAMMIRDHAVTKKELAKSTGASSGTHTPKTPMSPGARADSRGSQNKPKYNEADFTSAPAIMSRRASLPSGIKARRASIEREKIVDEVKKTGKIDLPSVYATMGHVPGVTGNMASKGITGVGMDGLASTERHGAGVGIGDARANQQNESERRGYTMEDVRFIFFDSNNLIH